MALAEVFEAIAGPDVPVEFAAYDGSHAGVAGSAVKITVRSPIAVAYLAQAPGALGLARAYVAGHLDVDGDMYEALTRMTKAQSISLSAAGKLRLLQALGGPKLLLHRMPPPPQEVRVHRRWLAGRRHSKGRDANAISHHYDVSNRFYEWVLGPTMAYTCACYPHQDATLEEAQITRPDNTEPAIRMRGFINRYVFPDGELEGPGYLISLVHDTGFEVRHEENLREHYAKTLAAWCANLDAHWDEAVAEVGQGTARVWRLYMAGSRLGFDRNQIELHQVLA
jgi:hypothetical protein